MKINQDRFDSFSPMSVIFAAPTADLGQGKGITPELGCPHGGTQRLAVMIGSVQ